MTADLASPMTTLALLPGLDGTGSLFADFAAALGPEIEVVAASYPADEPLSYTELEPIARAFLPAGRPFFLLGESFSGPLAISIAAAPPPGLRGVILCCSFARNPLPLWAFAAPFLGMLPVGALPVSLLSHFLLGRFATAALRDRLAQALTSAAPAVLKRRARAALTVDVSHRLRDVEVPLLYLRASEDRVVPKSASERIAAWVPKAQIVDFEAPHFLLQALPGAAASAVQNFIHQVSAEARTGIHQTGRDER